jgi:hypothetical protein
MKKLIAGLALSLLATAAFAGAGTITVLDSTGATKTYDVITDGSGNFLSKMGICDGAAGATCASVGTAGSPSTNALTVQAVTLGHGTAANAMRVELPTDGTGVVTAAQATAANLNATVVGTGTFATQSTLAAETTKNIGTIRATGNVGGVFDAIVAGTYPANALAVGVLNGSAIGRLVGDETNGLWVNIKAGAGSGGTALADEATFTQGTTNFTPAGCTFNNSITNLTSGQGGAFSCTAARSLHTTVDNTNANGQAAMANSSPVVIASNQSNIPTNTAQINGVTPLMGNGVSGTGSQRVNIASDNTAFPVNATGPVNVTATACSGTITSGGTAQNAFTAQTTLHGFTVANIDTTEPLWISFTTTAAASGTDSYPLPAATATTFAGFGSFTTPPGLGLNHALSVIAATTSHKYSCTWW